MRPHPHRRHAGVVHGDDAEADEASAEEEDFRRRLFATDGVKPDAGDENGDDERQGRQRDVVAHVHPRHAEGEHRHEVHRPDAAAHRDRGCREPGVAGPARRGSDAAGEIESRIGSRGGDQNGERDERRVVCSGDGHAQPARKRPMGETYSLSIRAESACHISNVRSERVRLCAVKARGVSRLGQTFNGPADKVSPAGRSRWRSSRTAPPSRRPRGRRGGTIRARAPRHPARSRS